MNLCGSTLAPRLIRRPRGGWLALTTPEAPIRIGASGATELEARAAFDLLVHSWKSARDAELAAQQLPD
jgi:hypothetical protein